MMKTSLLTKASQPIPFFLTLNDDLMIWTKCLKSIIAAEFHPWKKKRSGKHKVKQFFAFQSMCHIQKMVLKVEKKCMCLTV